MIRALSILTIIFFTTSCIQTVEKHDEVVFGQQNNIQDTMVRMQTEETNEMILRQRMIKYGLNIVHNF